jgi:signal transduction histidine kinase
MTRVLINLVANAVDAVEGKGAVVVRTVKTRDERGDGVEIHVQDDGPGIAPEVREKIFTPYFTTKPNGTGLGLAIVQRIVIDHGGEIVIAEAPGRGTDFVVRLRAAIGTVPVVAPAA